LPANSDVRQKLYDYLVQRPGGATSSELLGLLFSSGVATNNLPGSTPEFGGRFLHSALGADPHFFHDPSADRWHVTAHAALHQDLANATFVVVDLETTGLKPGPAAITKIAAIQVSNGQFATEFHSLINPGRKVPMAITQLTGITDDMLRDQPRIDTIFPQLHAFLGSSVVVAHNADFDFRFLNFDARRLLSAPLLNPSLCTLKLAKRLLPSLRSRSLDAVAAHLGVSRLNRHRALGDARTTSEIFLILLDQLSAHGVTTVGQLLDFQHTARDGRRFEFFVPRPLLSHIPESPGVYRMLDGEGHLLYIGKAKNLRRRVNSYFTNSSSHSNKVLDLVRTVFSLEAPTDCDNRMDEIESALRDLQWLDRDA
jgi:DNA polymerase-3 subunit epsilon